MSFTSVTFAFFLTLVFFLYWFVFNKNLKAQNLLLLISSYIFYGWWDWRFLLLLFFISISNYLIAIQIQKKNSPLFCKSFFALGLLINLSTLIVFKYFNFFSSSFTNLLVLMGFEINLLTLNIILPLGISFYIFLSLSYLIDVYQDKLCAVKNFSNALLSLSFFPIILAGPIQRPISLLPQIEFARKFRYAQASDGLKQILWGLFMKIVIADKSAVHVNVIFSDFTMYSSSTLILGAVLFTVQIYADFGGYSNIAIGTGKLLGFNLMQNFAYPYFARDMREFWRRWNISLTTWFRDYVFLPTAYSLSRKSQSARSNFLKSDFFIYIVGISITWTLTGLWHGANFTFINWGAIQGFFLIVYHLTIKPKKKLLKHLNISNNNSALIFFETFATLIIITFSWIFFRADNVGHALNYLSEIFSLSSFMIPEIRPNIIFFIILFFVIEWLGRSQEYAIAAFDNKLPKPLRWVIYYSIIIIILYYAGKEEQFIYFQF
jgi:D-alanyl-lipoteichoic acid acyltransferase DltB (MBOAT superfamily)